MIYIASKTDISLLLVSFAVVLVRTLCHRKSALREGWFFFLSVVSIVVSAVFSVAHLEPDTGQLGGKVTILDARYPTDLKLVVTYGIPMIDYFNGFPRKKKGYSS